MLRKEKINFRKAKTLGMYAIDLKTARLKWRQTPVTAYICLYQEINLKIVETKASWFVLVFRIRDYIYD